MFHLPAHRVLTVAIVVFFCLPMSRFYLNMQLDPEECLDYDHVHTASVGGHEHESHAGTHEHPSHAESPPASQDSDYYFQHCKDTYQGIALTPVQPIGLAGAPSVEPPRASWQNLTPPRCPSPKNLPSPKFHPPRHLG